MEITSDDGNGAGEKEVGLKEGCAELGWLDHLFEDVIEQGLR